MRHGHWVKVWPALNWTPTAWPHNINVNITYFAWNLKEQYIRNCYRVAIFRQKVTLPWLNLITNWLSKSFLTYFYIPQLFSLTKTMKPPLYAACHSIIEYGLDNNYSNNYMWARKCWTGQSIVELTDQLLTVWHLCVVLSASFQLLHARLKNTGYEVACPYAEISSTRAGHFQYFLIFSLIKNDFLHFLSS